jgi:hypothetical protein
MNCYKSCIPTTSGASEPQRSAGVDGSGFKTGSNVAGPIRSSSSDREGTGVADQAPVTLSITGVKTKNCGPLRQQRATWLPDVIFALTTVGKPHATTRVGYSQTERRCSEDQDTGTSRTKKKMKILSY